MCGSELFSGRSSKNNLFLSGEGGLSLIFWKLLGKLNYFILSTRSGPRLPRSAHRSECHLIMYTRQLLYAVVFLSACALWGGRNTIKYRKKIYTHVIQGMYRLNQNFSLFSILMHWQYQLYIPTLIFSHSKSFIVEC